METAEDVKNIVRSKYAEIAKSNEALPGCCGVETGCCSVDYSAFGEDYTTQEGYVKEADLGLGCGIPTQFANIKEGDTVVDLGSGAGNDAFVARSIVGDSGTVIGVDFTEEMIIKARKNAAVLQHKNVHFFHGDIENLPLESRIANVVVSNCVLNLVPDKKKAFEEIMRVLKPGGTFCVSDIVFKGAMPEGLRKDAEMYAGCVSGALQMEDYLTIIEMSGFQEVTVNKLRPIILPDDLMLQYVTPAELEMFKAGELGIISITVSGRKA